MVSNIFFKNRLWRSLTRFNFLTKIIKVSNICFYRRIFRNIYQNTNWPVNIFVIIFWSKVILLTRLYLRVSFFVELKFKYGFQDSLSRFLQLQSRWNRVMFPMLPMFRMFLFQCFKSNLLPLNSSKRIDGSVLSQNYSEISWIYLFGDNNFNFSLNTIILNATIS